MPEPATSFISASWLKPLWKKLNAIRRERDKEIQEIKNHFADPYDLARYYVEPNCQHHNPADHLEDQQPRSAIKSLVFRTINDFLEGDYAVTGSGKNQMFILSDAGMGKTSLLVMLKLTHLTSFWPKRFHCELLKLGPDTLDRVKAIGEAGDTVLLLDALDEDRAAWGRIQERLLEILPQTSHFRRVIVSCRTQFFPDTSADPFSNPGRVEIGGFVCPMIFLSLFDDRQVEEYLEKRYPDAWLRWFQANGKREKARGLVAKMKDLRCRPMLLAHVEDLVDSSLTDWNEYAVYGALIQPWLDREERKLRKEGRQDVTGEALYSACLLVADHMQRSGSRFLSEPKLHELMQAHPELAHLTQIKFGGRSLLNRNAQGDYRFSHFSVQEYLVAQGLLQASAAQAQLMVPAYASEKVIRFVLDGREKVCPEKPMGLRALNLARFDLKGARLEGSDLSDADLSGADLSGARLEGATFRGTRLDGANLTGVSLSQPIEGIPFSQKISGEIKIDLAWIPAGSFSMGEAGNQVEVRLSRGFWMSKYLITQRQYETLIGANPSHFKKSGPQAPVEQVDWDDARAFCLKLKERLNQTDNEGQHEFRLPTEAEWEYACRAGSEGAFCFDGEESELEQYAWYGKNSGGKTHAVGQKKPNAWGLYDVHGNVWEWCQDWSAEYPSGPVTDPTGPETGQYRVARGGSWDLAAANCRFACRSAALPPVRYDFIGFRVVLAPRSVP